MGVIDLSANSFEQEVLQTKELVLLDFWAPWCTPCKMLAPELEEISQEYEEKVKVCKLNVEENQALAASYQILSIPTILFFKGGRTVGQLTGVRAASDIKKTIDSLL